MNTRNRLRLFLALSTPSLALWLAGCHSENASVSSGTPDKPTAPSASVPAQKTPSGTAHRTVRAGLRSPRAMRPIANTALIAYQPTTKLFEKGITTPPNRVALTFDCCYSDVGVPLILQSLEERHLHCTFFMAGFFSNHFPASARKIADAGMELGNHSYTHPDFTKLNDEKVFDQLDRAEDSIEKACGRGAKPLFRFPYGASDRRTRHLVVDSGYQPIHWTLDSLDSVGKPKSADFIASRIISKIKPGSITLMHVSCLESAKALPRILEYLEKNNYRIVTVSELLLDQPAAATKPTEKTTTSKAKLRQD